jgi:hypothetical protein
LGITTNPDNPGFADIRIDPRWFRDRTPGGGGGIYTTGTVGIGLTQPRLGSVGILTDVKLDVLGDAIFSGIISATSFIGEFNVDTQDLNVSGIASFTGDTDNVIGDTNTGIVQIDGGVGIDKNVSIGASLNVNNLLTVGSAVTIGNGIVSATTGDFINLELDNLNVTGLSTFGDTARFNGAVNIFDDLFVSGNISVGGTGVTLDTETIRIEGKELLIGFTTTITPNDTTANAAGIAVASTEGYFLVDLQVPGINTTPNTYKQIKWFKDGTFVGQSTDAFISNQPISIGRTQIQNGQLFAVGNSINFTEDEITAPTFVGNLTGTATTATNLSNAANITTGTISSDRLTGSYDIDITGTATTATNLSNAANITTGTISSDRLTGSYDIDITGTATTATNLSDAANITTGTISSDRLTGSYDIDITGTATTATNLADAANITTGTISSDRLTGSYDIDITGNAGTASTASFATTAFNLDGFVESNLNVAFAQTAGLSTETTKLQTSRTFEITGDVVASPITFDGTGNVSLAATIQPNSVGLGTDTFGDYVKSITGTSNEVTVSVTSGEGSTPQIGLPNDVTIGQDLTVTRDVEINRNLNVNGNITIGGTSATLFTQTLTVADPDLILGVRTDALGNDISTDNTANHGGIAIASTDGNPLITLTNPGAGETLPSTYKKIMWFKSGSFSGFGTDAWLSNYAIGIGSTQFPTGTRLAAGSVQFTENDLAAVRNINSSGIVTASVRFEGNLTGTASTASFATTAFNLNGVVASDLSVATAVTATNLSDAANITTGTISSDRLTGSYDIDITGTATTATNLSNAANRLTGSYGIDITGTATTATNLSNAANITTGTISSDRLTGSYDWFL